MQTLFRQMVIIRSFEDRVARAFFQGELAGIAHLGQGQEAVAVGMCAALREGDRVAATYRGHAVCLARGVPPEALAAELLGRATGVCGGRSGSMNVVDLRRGVLGCFAIVGHSIGAATGAALHARVMKTDGVAVAFFGDGAANQAYFHECLNFAAVQRLPVVYVCENNLYGEWTPVSAVTGGASIAARAQAYGMPGVEADGNDMIAVLETAREAVTAARLGRGPTLIEFKTYRHRGHSLLDNGKYRPAEEVEAWLARDPIKRAAALLDGAVVERVTAEATQEIEHAFRAALAAPLPDPDVIARATAA